MEHCPACQGINIESPAHASKYHDLGLGYLRRSRETCRMCDFLCKAFEEPLSLEHFMEIWDDTSLFNVQFTKGLRPNLRVTVSTPTGVSVCENLTIHTNEDDPATQVGLLPRLSLPSSTRSCQSYATARKWIGDCLSGHPDVRGCMSRGAEIQQSEVGHLDPKGRLRRLVHVQPRGSGLLSRITDSSSAAHAYATLSHCVRKSFILDQTRLIDLR